MIENAPVSLYKLYPPLTAWSINAGNILQRTTTVKCIIHLKHFQALYQFDAGEKSLYNLIWGFGEFFVGDDKAYSL